MKEHMDNQPQEVVNERLNEKRKPISCHLKLSPEADSKLVKIQHLLREENVKLSKTSVINILLENLNVEYFSKDLSTLFGGKIQNKIVQLYLNSEMNDDDLKLLKMMEQNNKKKPEK
ncbi:TPA: hypothetical protein ACKE3U_003811 [Klebsiella aerogenes]